MVCKVKNVPGVSFHSDSSVIMMGSCCSSTGHFGGHPALHCSAAFVLCFLFSDVMLMLLYGAIVLGFTCKRDFWVFYSDCLSNFFICFRSVCWVS
jgi:hypothetical protein